MCGHEAKELANDGAIFVDRETPLNTSGLLGSRRCAAKSVRPEELFSTASKVYRYREQARFFWQKRQFHAVSGCSVSSWRRYFLHPEESPKQTPKRLNPDEPKSSCTSAENSLRRYANNRTCMAASEIALQLIAGEMCIFSLKYIKRTWGAGALAFFPQCIRRLSSGRSNHGSAMHQPPEPIASHHHQRFILPGV